MSCRVPQAGMPAEQSPLRTTTSVFPPAGRTMSQHTSSIAASRPAQDSIPGDMPCFPSFARTPPMDSVHE